MEWTKALDAEPLVHHPDGAVAHGLVSRIFSKIVEKFEGGVCQIAVKSGKGGGGGRDAERVPIYFCQRFFKNFLSHAIRHAGSR